MSLSLQPQLKKYNKMGYVVGSLRQNRQTRLKKKHAALPSLAPLLQKRAAVKGHSHSKNKAWNSATSLGKQLRSLEGKSSTCFGKNPCRIFKVYAFMALYFLAGAEIRGLLILTSFSVRVWLGKSGRTEAWRLWGGRGWSRR